MDQQEVSGDVAPTYEEGPTDKADSLPFSKICEQFTKMAKERTKSKRIQAIFTPEFYEYLDSQTVFPIMRLLLPSIDRERIYGLKIDRLCDLYIRCLLGSRDRSSDVAKRLLRWKDPTAANKLSMATGDFSSVLRDVLVYRGYTGQGNSNPDVHQRNQGMTVGELNTLLDTLAKATGATDDKKADQVRLEVFHQFLQRCNADEIFWITRIILKDLKVKLQHESVLSFVHPQAVDAFNIHMDLRRLCAELRDSSVTMVQQIQLFNVFKPMLAKRMVPETATKGMASFGIELKLDGERMLVHIDKDRTNGPKVKFYTRNGNDYTEKYGAALIPSILRNVRCRRCILDGEVVAFDKSLGGFIPFGNNRTVGNKARHAQALANVGDNYLEQQGQHLCFMVFDIMFVQGEEQPVSGVPHSPGCVTYFPLKKRREMLQHLVTPKPTYFEVLPQQVVSVQNQNTRVNHLLEALDKAILDRQEGLVIKNLESKYELGKRNTDWVKLKPDYVDGLGDDLDIIVLGGYFGEGKLRSGDVSHFLLGVADSQHDVNGFPTRFYTFCKVGSGYSVQELQILRKRLKPHWRKWDDSNCPAHISDWKIVQKKHRPDVWIEPKHSILFQVTGAEIVESDAFASRYTIRFPRVVCIRTDKAVEECMTYADLQKLLEERKGGMHSSTRFGSQPSSFGFQADVYSQSATRASKRKRENSKSGVLRVARKTVGSRGVIDSLKPATLLGKEGELLNSQLKGLEICVLPANIKMEPISFQWAGEKIKLSDKASVELFIQRCGGNVVAACTSTTDFVVAPGTGGIKYHNMVRFGARDILTPGFLVDCVEKGRIPMRPEYRFYCYMCADTRHILGKQLDAFGDHYLSHTDKRSFHNVLSEVERKWKSQKPREFATQPTREQWEELLQDGNDPLLTSSTLFRGAVAYFDRYEQVRTSSSDSQTCVDSFGELEVAFRIFQLQGGTIVQELSPLVKFVVVDPSNVSRFKDIRAKLRSWRLAVDSSDRIVKRILSVEWIYWVLESKHAWNWQIPDERWQISLKED